MKTRKNIFIAFILNLLFSVFELIGGIFTGSFAIVSDSVHDLGDALGIGLSYVFEKKSMRAPDQKYTYGYLRYSVLGGLITTVILISGSIAVIVGAVGRIIEPTEINYNGMIVFTIVGVAVNFIAAFVTREGDSINQRAVNLHMLEDIMGWLIVLIGAIVIKFTGFYLIDPIMSVCVASFILVTALGNIKESGEIFLEKTPRGIDIEALQAHITGICGVSGVHHIHIRSIDGVRNYATMHIVTDADHGIIKKKVREELLEHGIVHSTLELEKPEEPCPEIFCKISDICEKKTHSHAHFHGKGH